MKKNEIRKIMSKKAIAGLMAVMIMAAPVTSVSFAGEEQAADGAAQVTTEQAASPAESKSEAPAPAPAPAKPAATSHNDNSKIEDYNKQVDAYNESAKQYNDSVDKEYNAAVEETNRMNEEIDKHNAEEQQRVKDAEERNAQAQKAAEEANKKIDEENEAEKARVEQVNKDEETKAAASEKARADAEALNEEIKEHNAKVDQYNADLKTYEAAYAQYEYDLGKEAQILKLGYASVAQYNATIERVYNNPAKISVEKNATAPKISVSDTYTIKEAAEKSGAKVTVHIEHNLMDLGISYTEDFEIDRNDIITVNPMSAICESTSPGYATFYYNTDDQHQMGYWMEAWSSVGYNAKYYNTDWNSGDTHEISYKDGKNHANDKEEIVVEYNYMWNPLKVYKTFNTPSKPEALVDPGAARELVDVPELYVPKYESFISKQHVTAELENIAAADIWEKIADPVKKAYISLLDHMALFDVPEAPAAPEAATAKAVEKAAPAADTAKASNTAESAAPEAAGIVIADNAMPLAAADAEEISDSAVPMAVMDSETPMAQAGAWALINLLSALATALLSLIMMARYFGARREENEETGEITEIDRKGALRLASLIPAIGSIAAFIFTENMANPMILTDQWTALMIAILAVQAGVALLSKKSEDSSEELENA